MNTSSHLALVCASLNGGGAQRVLLNLSAEFAQRGYEVDLVLARMEGDYVNEVSEHVRVVDLGATRMLSALPRLVAYFRRERPDATMSTMAYVNTVVTAAKYLSGSSTRLILREAAVPTKGTASTRQSFVHGLMPFLRNMAYPLADGIISISNGAAAQLVQTTRLSEDHVSIIHNPACPPGVSTRASRSVGHPWLTADFDEPVVLGMGRLGPCKNFDLTIRAVASIARDRPIRLIICGKGRLQNELEQLVDRLGIRDRVDFPGFVNNPFAYMKRADVFVLSSTREAFGNVVVEALATGTPVVSTNCPGGPPEILEGGKWGRLVPVGDADAMAEAIMATLDENHAPERLKQRAQDFNVETVANEYLSVLLPE